MVHYTCDLCGRTIGKNDDARYRVYIEIEEHPVDEDYDEDEDDDESDESEDEDDESEETDNYGESDEGEDDDYDEYEESGAPAEDNVYRSFKFDLCPECVELYIKNPLPKSLKNRAFFNEN